MKLWAPQPRQPFVGLAVAAMVGIFAADRLSLGWPWAFAVAALGLIVLLLRPSPAACWLFFPLAFFELHTLRHGDSDARWLAKILGDTPKVVHGAGIVWSEPEKPATWSGNSTLRFVVKLESIGLNREETPVDALANMVWVGLPPVYGDRVTFIASASNLGPRRNPGEFDSTSYQQRHGIYSEIHTRFAADCEIQSHGHGNPIQAFALKARHWIQHRLEIDLGDSPEICAVIDGVVLGLRGESPEDLKTLLQRTGTIHLFVVSGLNIVMLSTIIFYLLKPFGFPRSFCIVIVILALAAYAVVTGLRTSTVRSAIMAAVLLSATLFDRRSFSINSLAFAALVLLGFDTNELFAPGFQFSFTIVFVIILCASRIHHWFAAFASPDPFLPRLLWSWPVRCRTWCWDKVSAWLGVIFASWIGSLVFTVGYFHLFSPGSIVANFLAVPVAFLILTAGIASILFGEISLHFAVLFNNANWFSAKAMLAALNFSANLPSGYVYVETPKPARAPHCELTILDVGEGGAVHLRAGKSDWLFDCGDIPRYTYSVLPYLRSRGVNRLDGLLITHGSARHMAGATTAIEDFRPFLLADSPLADRSPTRQHLHTWLEQRRLGKGLYMRDDVIQLGNAVSLRVLYPPTGIKRSAAADKALVLQLQAGRTRALLMSASGFSTEQWLLENEPDLHSDILIKGQHTKDFSGTSNFLTHVAPQVVVCGQLGYGKPLEELDTWSTATAAQGITVFRQDKTGAVHIDIRDDSYEVRGFVDGQTFRSRAR